MGEVKRWVLLKGTFAPLEDADIRKYATADGYQIIGLDSDIKELEKRLNRACGCGWEDPKTYIECSDHTAMRKENERLKALLKMAKADKDIQWAARKSLMGAYQKRLIEKRQLEKLLKDRVSISMVESAIVGEFEAQFDYQGGTLEAAELWRIVSDILEIIKGEADGTEKAKADERQKLIDVFTELGVPYDVYDSTGNEKVVRVAYEMEYLFEDDIFKYVETDGGDSMLEHRVADKQLAKEKCIEKLTSKSLYAKYDDDIPINANLNIEGIEKVDLGEVMIIDDPMVEDSPPSRERQKLVVEWYNDVLARGMVKPTEISKIWHIGDLMNIRKTNMDDLRVTDYGEMMTDEWKKLDPTQYVVNGINGPIGSQAGKEEENQEGEKSLCEGCPDIDDCVGKTKKALEDTELIASDLIPTDKDVSKEDNRSKRWKHFYIDREPTDAALPRIPEEGRMSLCYYRFGVGSGNPLTVAIRLYPDSTISIGHKGKEPRVKLEVFTASLNGHFLPDFVAEEIDQNGLNRHVIDPKRYP